MKIPRNATYMVEPPSVATGDIAFNLLIFFLVCASSQPDSGRRQEIPRSEKEKQETKSKNVEVSITRQKLSVGEEGTGLRDVSMDDFAATLQRLMTGKAKPEDRIVMVKSTKDTPYHRWIEITAMIEQAGGTITLQLSDEKEVVVP